MSLTRTIIANYTGTIDASGMGGGFAEAIAYNMTATMVADIGSNSKSIVLKKHTGTTLFAPSAGSYSGGTLTFNLNVTATQELVIETGSVPSVFLDTDGVRKDFDGGESAIFGEGALDAAAGISWKFTHIKIELTSSVGNHTQEFDTPSSITDAVCGMTAKAYTTQRNTFTGGPRICVSSAASSASASVSGSADGFAYSGATHTSSGNWGSNETYSGVVLSGSVSASSNSPALTLGTSYPTAGTGTNGKSAYQVNDESAGLLKLRGVIRELDQASTHSVTGGWYHDSMPGVRSLSGTGTITDDAPLTQYSTADIYTDGYGFPNTLTSSTNVWHDESDRTAVTNLRCWIDNPDASNDWGPFGFIVGEQPRIRVAHASSVTLWSGSTAFGSSVAFSPAKKAFGYRYMRLSSGSSADTLSVTVGYYGGSKVYTAKKTSAGVHEIDLMAPDGLSAGGDATDSSWPKQSATDYQHGDGPMEGVSYLTSVTVAGSGTLSTIELFRKSFSKLTILRSYAGGKTTDWELAWPEVVVGDITTTTKRRLLVQLNTDGRVYNGLTADFWVHSENSGGGAVTDSLSEIDTGQMMSLLNGVPGYTVTDVRPSGYNHIPISYLGCGGGWNPKHGQSLVELDVSGTDIWGADIYSVLTLGGGVGDVADLTSSGDPLVRFAYSVRGAASATVINPDGPEVSDTVKLGSSGSDGTGTTDSQGYGKTGAPNASTNASRSIGIHRISGTDPAPIAVRTLVRHIRKSSWWLGAIGTTTFVSYAVSSSYHHARGYITEAGKIAIGYASNVTQAWVDQVSSTSATWVRLHHLKHQKNILGVLHGDGTNIHFGLEKTASATLTSVIDLGAGAMADFRVGPSGILYLYKSVASSGAFDIYQRLMDTAGNVVQDWTITNLVGLSGSSLSVDVFNVGGEIRVGLLHSNPAPVFKVSTDGLNFA